jgi:prevent-host-death family protein
MSPSPAEFSEIPQRELRNEVSRVLREVKAGQSYTITVDGSPVADLIPHRHTRRRVAVPRAEILAAFGGPTSGNRTNADIDRRIDDSLYDPYDRAHRRGAFSDGATE